MKYKLINNKTKEEHICDKVTIDGFDYYFSNQLPKAGDTVYNCKSKQIYKITIEEEEVVNYEFPIICSNNPNIDIPKVVDEEDIKEYVALSVLKKQDWDTSTNLPFNQGFIAGYNKSQETHPFSEEDMIEFVEWLNKSGYTWNWRFKLYTLSMTPTEVEAKTFGKAVEELLQLWKEQKPKTLYYE